MRIQMPRPRRSGNIACNILLIIALAMVVWADSPIQWRGNPGWEPEGAYCQLYNSHNVTTLVGKVVRIEKIIPMKGMGYGIYLTLQTDKETLPVHLGPTAYVESLPVQFHARDTVEVTGSRVMCDGKTVILAAQVKHGKDVATYREFNGVPSWSAKHF